jgi:hypothetical protein
MVDRAFEQRVVVPPPAAAGHASSTPVRDWTPRAKRVLEVAVQEARYRGVGYLGTEHLLLAMVREGGIGATLLSRLASMTRRTDVHGRGDAATADLGHLKHGLCHGLAFRSAEENVTARHAPSSRRLSPSRSDPGILAELLALHAIGDRVFDASWGHGRIWDSARLGRYQPTRLDIRPETTPDAVGDWNQLADLSAPASFDVVVWDPPHITDAGAGLVGSGEWANLYGTRGLGLRAINVCHLFAPFLQAARAVLEPRAGTLVVQLADQVHAGVLQWQPFELRKIACQLGWLACDYQVRVRAQPVDPKWQVQHHVRRGATFWLAFHTGRRCPNPGLDLVRVCAGASDGHLFRPGRRDQLTCSDRCRQHLHRQRSTS